MGLRCLLGHDFGPPGVVREHEEDGNEMVITEREIQRCKRCGEEQIIAESTEVRAIMSEDDLNRETDSDRLLSPEETTGVDPAESPVENPAEATTGTPSHREDAESEAGAATDAVTGADGGTTPTVDADVGPEPTDDADDEDSNTSLIERAEAGFDDEPADPDEEDAVILDESDEKPPRKRGEWPDSSDVGDPTPRDAGDSTRTEAASADEAAADSADEAADSVDPEDSADDPRSLAETAAEEDAELLGDDNGADVETATGAQEPSPSEDGSWPSHEDAEADEGFAAQRATAGGPSMAYGNELTPSTNGESAPDDGYDTSYLDNTVEERDGDGTIVSANAETETPPPGVETEYYCPNCGHTRPLDSSLRSGDICPGCQSGYIAERAR